MTRLNPWIAITVIGCFLLIGLAMGALSHVEAQDAAGASTGKQRLEDSAPYRMTAGDILKIQVFPKMADYPIDGLYRVARDGRVALGPLVGRVTLAGMTPEAAEAAIVRALKDLVSDPKVQVSQPFNTPLREPSFSGTLAGRGIEALAIGDLDLLNLVSVIVDAESDYSISRLSNDNMKKLSAEPGVVTRSEIEISQIKFRAAKRKLALLRGLVLTALRSADADVARLEAELTEKRLTVEVGKAPASSVLDTESRLRTARDRADFLRPLLESMKELEKSHPGKGNDPARRGSRRRR